MTIRATRTDYFAVVGSIAQNAARDEICLAAIDIVAPANLDALPGTHAYLAGNFAWNNKINCGTDGEAMMLDTLDAHGWTGQIIVRDNMIWQSERYGLQVFFQNIRPIAPRINIHHNTLFQNNVGGESTSAGFASGDINLDDHPDALLCTSFPSPTTFRRRPFQLVRSHWQIMRI
jgi:hypothetical protein